MSRFMVIGGFVGFLIVFVAGLMGGRSMLTVLRDGMIACLIMAFLLRLLYTRIEGSMALALEKEVQAMREAARAQAAREKAEEDAKREQSLAP